MTKIKIIVTLLLMGISICSYSQQQKKITIKPALLVIDIQNAYLEIVPEREKETALFYINTLIDLFRSNGHPIIRIYHISQINSQYKDSVQYQFPASVPIRPEDPKIVKTYGDGFNKTDLDRVLRERGCNTLFLCGLSATGCVLATRIGALNHDYNAFLVKDAIMSHDSDYTNNIEDIFNAVGYKMVQLIAESSE